MRFGKTLSKRRGKSSVELSNKTNTDLASKNSRRKQKNMTTIIHKLFDTCEEVFVASAAGVIPPPEDIQKLKSVLDAIKPEDVGVSPDIPCFRKNPKRAFQEVTYLHIFDCGKFSIGIFCLPPSGVIPLHNHPGMTVFSKLLFGKMHIKSYDWVVDMPPDTPTIIKPPQNAGIQNTADARLAKVKVDADFTAPCDPSILYPADGGNLHCFTAVTACAVLDVLGPPYSDRESRHCQYYFNHLFNKFPVEGISIAEEEKNGYEWLQECEKPKDFVMTAMMYRGPRVGI